MREERHLTEDERQALADDLATERRDDVQAHLSACGECRDDVERLRKVTMRFRSATDDPTSVDELWPSIRARIEAEKIVAISSASTARQRWFRARHAVGLGALAAAAMLTVVLLRPSHRIAVDSTAAVDDSAALRLVTDSLRSYEDESRVLLNQLELQRAMMRPEAAASIDRDLKVIDQAIGELQLAIRNDPRNPALRSLLASSYRQKVELLKRANNAS
jgi:anti-sigma factor RsiW